MTGFRSLAMAAGMALALATGGCATQQVTEVLSTKSPVELRAMQTRAFETTDQNKMLRTIVATLQDNGYTIDKVEPPAGTVSATKLAQLRLTATATPHGTSQIAVRANAMVRMPNLRDNQVDDPQFYQQLFFEPLSKAIFLSALQVDDVRVSDAEKSFDGLKRPGPDVKTAPAN
ncbi:MAG: hypothetical protein JWL84_3920 [Rhodospirillales bacterium]|jgi:hypothetical protein|nr:hypothetical protein [Rhodospirillales bacterium]